MVRQTVPDGYYPVSEVKFSQVTVGLSERFINVNIQFPLR